MELVLHKLFKKQYSKLTPKIRHKADITIATFLINPKEPSLKNHALKGGMISERSISVTGDIRIVFKEYNNYKQVRMLRIGTHNQVY